MGIEKRLFLRMVHHVSQSCLVPDSQSYHDDGSEEGHNALAELLIQKEVIMAEDVEHIFGKRPWLSRSQEIMEDEQPKIDDAVMDMPEVQAAIKEHEEAKKQAEENSSEESSEESSKNSSKSSSETKTSSEASSETKASSEASSETKASSENENNNEK